MSLFKRLMIGLIALFIVFPFATPAIADESGDNGSSSIGIVGELSTDEDNGTEHGNGTEGAESLAGEDGSILVFDANEDIGGGAGYDPDEIITVCFVNLVNMESAWTASIGDMLSWKDIRMIRVGEDGSIETIGDSYFGDCDGRTPGSDRFLSVDIDKNVVFCDHGTTYDLPFDDAKAHLEGQGATFTSGQAGYTFTLPVGITGGSCDDDNEPEPNPIWNLKIEEVALSCVSGGVQVEFTVSGTEELTEDGWIDIQIRHSTGGTPIISEFATVSQGNSGPYYVDFESVELATGEFQAWVFRVGSNDPVKSSMVVCGDTENDDGNGEAELPDADIGENQLIVQLSLPGDVDIEGAPYSLYAPRASMLFMAEPYKSGFVGTNNTIDIDGLIPGAYKLVVTPVGMDPSEAVITVADQPITQALVIVNEDGSTTIKYAVTDDSSEGADGTSTASPDSGKVTTLPETGVGDSASGVQPLMMLLTAGVVLMGSAFGFRRNQ